MTDREPDLELAGFTLWVNGRFSPDAEDPHGLDILSYEVRVETAYSVISCPGWMSSAGLAAFVEDLSVVYETLEGRALLDLRSAPTSMSLTVSMRDLGKVDVDLALVLDDRQESHTARWASDQSYLKPFVKQLRALNARYPSPFPTRKPTSPASTKQRLTTVLMDVIFGKADTR